MFMLPLHIKTQNFRIGKDFRDDLILPPHFTWEELRPRNVEICPISTVYGRAKET